MNVPNSLTVTRIFLVPFLVVVLLTRMENSELWGVGILLGPSGRGPDRLAGRLCRPPAGPGDRLGGGARPHCR
jgi:hypothetical protein